MDTANRFAEDGGDGELNDFALGFQLLGIGGEGNGVGDDDFGEDGIADALGGGAGENWMGSHGVNGFRAFAQDEFSGGTDGSGGVDHVVYNNGGAVFDITDDVEDFGHVVGATTFVDNRNRGVQLFRVDAGAFHATGIGADDDEIAEVLLLDVAQEDWSGVQVIHQDVEEALELAGMEIHGDHAGSPGGGDEVGHQLGGDGFTSGAFAILTGIAVVRDDGGDGVGASALESVNHHQEFDDVVVDGVAGGLDDKSIAAAHVFFNLDVGFAVAEVFDFDLTQFRSQVASDFMRQPGIGSAGKNFHFAGVVNAAFDFQFGQAQLNCQIVFLHGDTL